MSESDNELENSPPRKSKKMHYNQKYCKLWETEKEYAGWVEASPKGHEFFRCKVCGCDLKCGGGRYILNKHASSSKHIKSVKGLCLLPCLSVRLGYRFNLSSLGSLYFY